MVIGKYENNEVVKVNRYKDSEKEMAVKGSLTIKCNANGLAIRDFPDMSIKDAWYKTEKGWISAYRIQGKVSTRNKKWIEHYDHVQEEIVKDNKKV